MEIPSKVTQDDALKLLFSFLGISDLYNKPLGALGLKDRVWEEG